jgi:hypothetical protein
MLSPRERVRRIDRAARSVVYPAGAQLPIVSATFLSGAVEAQSYLHCLALRFVTNGLLIRWSVRMKGSSQCANRLCLFRLSNKQTM